MSRALIVILVLAALGPDQPAAPPPLNAKVVEYARGRVGQQVGDGQCTALVVEALRSVGAKRFPPHGREADYVWGVPVAEWRDVRPGDVLQFRDAIFRGRRVDAQGQTITYRETFKHHSAIVAEVGRNPRVLAIWHSNVSIDGEDPAERLKVRRGWINLAHLQTGGSVRAYRPVASGDEEPRPR